MPTSDMRTGDARSLEPSAPIYIPSKGRWDTRLTMKALDALDAPYRVIVEAEQFDQYAAVLGEDRLLVLDPRYQRDYQTCDALGDAKSRGPGPARNFAWDHAQSIGARWHWVMDDNIKAFYRLNRNLKVPVTTPVIFRAMEDFADRYTNVAMAGPNYFMFASRKTAIPVFTPNTRIYSCNLIRNDAPFRWRGRYNEDTDLSLRMLKAGWCTVLFNAFLQEKTTTQYMGGGNTAEFYAVEGTLPKSKMLVDLHPDVARVVQRWGRDHHVVDYSPFKANKLIRRPDVKVRAGVDNYGMELVEVARRSPPRGKVATPKPASRRH